MEVVHRLATLVLLVSVISLKVTDAACSFGSTNLGSGPGELTSENYPSDYDKGQTCQWIISSGNINEDLYIEITDLDIYQNSSLTCSQADYLRIENRNDASDVWVDNICGNLTTPIIVTSNYYSAYVIFVTSNFGTSGRGFKLTWSTPPTTTSTTSTSTTTSTTTQPTTITSTTATTTTTTQVNQDFTTTISSILAGEIITITIIIVVVIVGVVIVIIVVIICCVKKKASRDARARQENERLQAMEGHKQRSSKRRVQVAPLQTPQWNFDLPHIMISYQGDVRPEVLEFRQKLADAGYRVWIDVEQMHRGVSASEAIPHSAVFIPVLTKQYQQSTSCRKEIELADKLNKPIIPIQMERNYQLHTWLDYIIGGMSSHTFCDKTRYNEELANFFSVLENLAEDAKMEENEQKSGRKLDQISDQLGK